MNSFLQNWRTSLISVLASFTAVALLFIIPACSDSDDDAPVLSSAPSLAFPADAVDCEWLAQATLLYEYRISVWMYDPNTIVIAFTSPSFVWDADAGKYRPSGTHTESYTGTCSLDADGKYQFNFPDIPFEYVSSLDSELHYEWWRLGKLDFSGLPGSIDIGFRKAPVESLQQIPDFEAVKTVQSFYLRRVS